MTYPVRFVGGVLDGRKARISDETVLVVMTQWGIYALDTRAEDEHDGYVVFREYR